MVWVLETRPFFAPVMISGAHTYPSNQLHPVCATITTDPTAVSASDVAGDTPWTNLGPNFHGNLFIIAIPYPPHNPPSHQFCGTVLEPRGACFCASQANHGGYSPLLSLICPCQTFRSTKATPRADFGGDLLSTFSVRQLPTNYFLVGRCSIPPPHNYNT